jgi:hypothetical protein
MFSVSIHIQYIARILSKSSKAREIIKGIQIGKEAVKLPIFTGKLSYLEVPKDSIKKLLDLINTFGKIEIAN